MDKPSPDNNQDRRRRRRLAGVTPGWVMPDQQRPRVTGEVLVQDVSKNGVRFDSTQKFDSGHVVRIRIGRGPIELAKRARVVRCIPSADGKYAVGAEFV